MRWPPDDGFAEPLLPDGEPVEPDCAEPDESSDIFGAACFLVVDVFRVDAFTVELFVAEFLAGVEGFFAAAMWGTYPATGTL